MLLAEIVAEESGGRLQPQIATRARPYTLLGGLNEDGQTMRMLPNFRARVLVTQIHDHEGQPGAGMLHDVCSRSPAYVPTPASLGELRCHPEPDGACRARRRSGRSAPVAACYAAAGRSRVGPLFGGHMLHCCLRHGFHEGRRRVV